MGLPPHPPALAPSSDSDRFANMQTPARLGFCGLLTVCGTATDVITIRDNGDNTCTGSLRLGTAALVSTNCRSLAFPRTICGSYRGFLTIIISRQRTTSYVGANIAQWLSFMGLADLNVIGGTLTIYVDNTPLQVPGPQNPNFLGKLNQVGALVVSECANCAANPETPAAGNPGVLASLPGLVNLKKFPTNALSSLIIRNTGFANFDGTFRALVCSPSQVQISNNTKLVSFSGILLTSDAPGPAFYAAANRIPGTSAGVGALRTLAGCPSGNTSTLTSPCFISTTTCFIRVRGPPPAPPSSTCSPTTCSATTCSPTPCSANTYSAITCSATTCSPTICPTPLHVLPLHASPLYAPPLEFFRST